MMMEANQITKQVLEFQKGAFSSWFGVLSILQDQADLTVDTMLKQTRWMPDEGRQAILSWVSACRQERGRYKAYVEQSFSGFEKYLVKEVKSSAAKSKKPVAKKKSVSAKPKKPASEVKKTVSAESVKPPVEEKKAAPARPEEPVAEEKKGASAIKQK
ncbi:MAG: hypothetical protein PVH87_22450 [Desulfobacteraceae bacterium]|jgi:hypothetical protein